MTGRWIVNFILLLVVIALGAAARHELATSLTADGLTGLDPERIAEVTIERNGEPAIRLQRTGEGWRMQAPYAVDADAARIDQLVRIAATPVYRSLPETALADHLGLAPERVRLTLDGLALRFGDTDPIDQRRYVAIGDRIHLINDGFQHHLLAPATDYVSNRLLPAGFHADSGTLDGQPLSTSTLTALGALTATRVTPVQGELSGRLLSLRAPDGGKAVRFLVSADGRRWTRVDLHLTYLLAASPALETVGKEDAPASDQPATPASHE
jgi:hypothetical protein